MWLIYPEIRDFQILITKTVFHEASLATKFAQVICDQQFSNFSTEQKNCLLDGVKSSELHHFCHSRTWVFNCKHAAGSCMLTVSPPVKIGVEFTIEPNHPYYFSQQ